MFGSDNATWMVVGVVVVILIIVVVCYFGKSQKSAPYLERFSEKKSEVIQGKECKDVTECGDPKFWSCFGNNGGDGTIGNCARRCTSSDACTGPDWKDGTQLTCRGNNKCANVRGYCVGDGVGPWTETGCASSNECNIGYDCKGNVKNPDNPDLSSKGICVKKCSSKSDCGGADCERGRCNFKTSDDDDCNLNDDQAPYDSKKGNSGEGEGEGSGEGEGEGEGEGDEGFSNYYEHFADKNRGKTAPKKPIKKVDKMRRPAPKKTAPKKSAPKNMKENFYGGCYY